MESKRHPLTQIRMDLKHLEERFTCLKESILDLSEQAEPPDYWEIRNQLQSMASAATRLTYNVALAEAASKTSLH